LKKMKKVLLFLIGMFLVGRMAFAAEAKAVLHSTQDPAKEIGTVTLKDTAEGLDVRIELKDAPQGTHAIHIHENGSCDDKGNAAGGHFNPDQVKHGYLPKEGLGNAHPGDMGNVEVRDNGQAEAEVTLPDVTLKDGKYNVNGKAIVLHEKADDFGQPTGNAGGREACGLIVLEEGK
jgi:superoxide dismutase, Cu-Zn family